MTQNSETKITIAVTGANGFVGSNLALTLTRAGHNVVALCRSPAELPTDSNIKTIETDYSPQALIKQLTDVQAVIHLVAKTHNEDNLDEVEQYRQINVELTKTIAQSAAAAGVEHFVYLSSIKVNGETTKLIPFNSHNSPRPTTAYGISKWEAEQALHLIHRKTGLKTTIVRCPLVYSPDAKGNIRALRKAINKGIPLPLGSIKNKRTIIDLEQLSQTLMQICTSRQWDNQTLLVGNKKSLSTAALARKLGADIGVPARIVPFPVFILKALFALTGNTQTINKLCESLEITPDLPEN